MKPSSFLREKWIITIAVKGLEFSLTDYWTLIVQDKSEDYELTN